MDFTKAFGCRIAPGRLGGANRTAEETFMRGLKAVQQLGDDVNWREVVAYYQQAADEVGGAGGQVWARSPVRQAAARGA